MSSLLDNTGDFNLADEAGRNFIDSKVLADSHGETPSDFVRSESFSTGLGSHSKVADIDPTENKELKIGSPPTPPGVKVGSPLPKPGKKVAKPLNVSTTGDFRRPIKVSAENPEDRKKVAIKLYAGAQNPLMTGRFRKGQ